MLEVCASKIGDIILSVLESKMENKLDEVKKAKIISDTRKSICEFEEKYLQNHDGTVLTSREFGEYLQYSKPIEEIFSTIWDTSTEIAGTTEIVEKLSTQCIESIKEKGRTIPPTENHLIKHFFEASVEIVSKMAREAITPGERMTQMQIKDLRNDMDGKLAGIQAQLNQRERLSPEEEKSIFDALYTILCSGEVHQIQKLVPLFQKKSDSIERALSVLIQLMAGESNSPEVIVESIQKIENCYVRNIVIRFIIAYGFLWKEVVGEISSSSVDPKFKKIAGNLYTENWDKIFELKRDEKEYRVVLLVEKEYREEIWLGKRILFWYLNRFRDKCVVGLDDDLFKQPITIYDEILLAWGKTHLYGGEDKEGKTKKEIENLLRRKSIVENLGIQSQLLYWEILFEICMENGDKETVVHYLPQIPDQIKESKTIKKAKFFVQILDENVNEQELLRATENDGTIYGQYFSMHAQLCGEREEKCNGLIQENTSAVLCEEETGNKYVVCVYAEALIPNRNGLKQPYTWENAFHMTVSDAVEKNLYLQKKGDKITIGKKTYVVESVVSVDHFLFQKAMNKSLEQGIAYKIEIPTLENGRTNIDAFFDEIKKYTPEKNDLLEEYRKMDKVPLPLYALRQSVTIPYGQFVHIAFRDSMIVIRSDSHLSVTATKNTRYVLSFSAAIFFMQAGIIAEDLIQNNVYIPESLHELLDMEWSKTLQDKSREKIATMMFDQGQPIIHEESDEEKRYFIQEAGKRKSESEKLKFIKNNKSINIHGRDDIQLQDLFGICDYDALSIAVHQDFTLVAFEPLLIAMSQKELLNFQCTGIVDFLCVTDFPLDKILKVICFMAKCKFEKILSDEIISVLIQKFDEVESDEEREKCMALWFEFFDVLDKKEDESEYKGLFVQNVLIALQAYLRKGGSEQEIRKLTRKPMIKVAICLLYNSKCIDLQYDEKRVLPTTEQEMGKNG